MPGPIFPDRPADESLIVLNGAHAAAAGLGGAVYGQRALHLARRLVEDACPRL